MSVHSSSYTNGISINEQDRYRALVTATSDVIYTMSPDWSVMQQLNGGTFLSSSGEPINNWMDKYLHPIDQEMVRDAIADAIKTKSMFKLEHRVLRADGGTGWAFSRAIPILNQQGEVTEWFGAVNDVTSRKEMEVELKVARFEAEHQRRLTEVVTSNTPDLVYMFDLNYRFTFANPALLQMWGKTWDEAIGRNLLENGYEDWHAEMHEREIDHVVATKRAIRGEVAFPHAVFGRRVYDYIFSPVFNAEGEVEAIAGTTRDISEIKENEQRKNDFISMVSHELKTPLTSVISYVQVAKKRMNQLEDKMAADMLERANKQLGKMTRMINGFLNVSRLESGRIQIDRQTFSLAELVTELQDEVLATVSSHSIKFNCIENIFVNADREKIAQVFNNLISNATKYSPVNSNIEVSCFGDNESAVVAVKDNGMGISEADLPRLFERYYRVKDAELNHISGFGIGLYLCAEIINLHGGQIWAESEPGAGSAFYFTLPAVTM
ncbi:PAS domain-containing sensor histidine kinase [Mucilaginibacter aquatilis]|uniref:histidine kinase n=1 Tax=Mucilaginibacter aquatilis TaxID=1517760 RepID=A0A6I4IQF9_9SPHI|nr:PAS domain-containing sensor histidine kinase [Mucilaginibacter aquatilis]MVN91623.1 PAS domain-containing protein [Mucilaginibacter aquatilis]